MRMKEVVLFLRADYLQMPGVPLAKRGALIVCFKTSQAGHLRTIFEALRDLIQDVNLHFIPDDSVDNTPGILLFAMDNSHVAVAHLKLPATLIRQADEFICTRQCSAGLSVPGFGRYLKTMGNDDIVSLSLYEGDEDNLYLVGETPSSGKRREFVIHLMDIDEGRLDIPAAQFDCVFTMKTIEFQRLCRDMGAVEPDEITIEGDGKTLTWTGVGSEADMQITFDARTEEAERILFETEARSIMIGNKYSLKYLTMFTKATALCNTVRIHLKPRFPIILDYDIPALGVLRFCLAPKMCEDDESENVMEDTMEDNAW